MNAHNFSKIRPFFWISIEMIFEKRASVNGNVRKKVNWVVGPHTSDATICLARIQED